MTSIISLGVSFYTLSPVDLSFVYLPWCLLRWATTLSPGYEALRSMSSIERWVMHVGMIAFFVCLMSPDLALARW